MVRPRTPLMLLPAMGCDGQLWARQIVDLAAVAQVDFGDLSQDDTLSEMAARVLASAPPRFAVAGVSLGGYVAMEMVRQAPDRIERIALFGTRASMEVRPRTVVGQGLLATAPHADPRLTAIVAGPAQAMAERVGQTVFERQQRALLARPDISEAIAAIHVPTLVAVGDRDLICTPATPRALSARIEGSRFHMLRSCGHLAPMERPGEVTALLRQWLKTG
ncbi:alpha/beta fold hydrolase [Sphingomonas sp. H160509]|uniref:alpha/beta fold hydrolase n=1 Tax=Sphingomonas sp. H160509 TaxID=2955313 RepID=UPI002096EBAB|nr:alpha/beta fold hydrolase [Sphingomonas sp. H160509]MDD1451905.1 alpha/beta fold hydrolase [Sphingomonas sp. H160509]